MTDSMKFGPEWLRNMSNDSNTGGTSSSSTSATAATSLGPRHQLGEYRYGREEMLSLFDKNLKMPEILPTFKKLFVDKVQCPLALIPSTEDEIGNATRPWVMRSPVNFGTTTVRAISRGGSVDRGRGRTRGGFHTSIGYQRPTGLYDDEIRGIGRNERSWPERNGGNEIGTSEWNSSPSSSPRKEYNSHGRGANIENWRRNRTEEDAGDGWRAAYRWSRSTSWRDEDASETGKADGGGIPAMNRSFSNSASTGNILNSLLSSGLKGNSHSNSNNNCKTSNSQWDQDDMLPEWAMENPTDIGGSFDASGAFHEPNEQNDDENSSSSNNNNKHYNRNINNNSNNNNNNNNADNISGNNNNNDGNNEEVGEDKTEDLSDCKSSEEEKKSVDEKKSSNDKGSIISKKITENKTEKLNVNEEASVIKDSESSSDKLVNNLIKGTENDQENKIIETVPPEQLQKQQLQQRQPPQPQKQQLEPKQQQQQQQQQQSILQQEQSKQLQQSQLHQVQSQLQTQKHLEQQQVLLQQQQQKQQQQQLQQQLQQHQQQQQQTHQHQQQHQQHHQHQQQPPPQLQQQLHQPQQLPSQQHNSSIQSKPVQHSTNFSNSSEPTISDQMKEFADHMIEKLIMDDEIVTTMCAKSASQMHKKNCRVTGNSPTSVPSLLQPPLVNNHPLMPQPQPPPTRAADFWYYRDPQGNVQGPFPANEMAEWYRLEYFDDNLYVRRACDSRYATLGELVEMCGNNMPFHSSHLIPPLVDNSTFPSVAPIQHVQQATQPTQQQGSMNSKQNVNLVMGASDHVTSLNIQLQYLQKQYLMRQQSAIIARLATAEPWSLLTPEQQQQVVNQKMTHVVLPDHLLTLSAFANYLSIVSPSTYNMQQILSSVKNFYNPIKPPQPSMHNPLGSFRNTHNDFSTTSNDLHNLMPCNQSQPMNQNISTHHTTTSVDNDPIKTLLMQLQMHKGVQPNIAPPTQSVQQNKWGSNIVQHQPSWPTAGSSTNTTTPINMWNFGQMPTHNKTEMKTEQQILEEQLQNEKLSRQVNERSQLLEPEQLPPQMKKEQQQQQPEKAKSINEEKIIKVQKHDDDMKKASAASKSNKVDKKEIVQQKKLQINEEERKKDAAEERKRQKEEKRRLQMEEEKKRLMVLEEEKRRQQLEEKKRQDEIDQHRRAKMLESSTILKPVKSNYESGRISSSIAPWSNTGLPGITTPGPNFAEIQKAERERRAEEQRLEQLQEHQRKNQQMEMQVQKESTLKWNAQPIRPLNVKSLAEIQAEEHKRQMANEQATAMVVEQSRRKDEISLMQSSAYSNNNTFNSIWNNRSPQSIAWNGKAWSTTSNSGFWEEPTKIPSNPSKQQVSTARSLSKSQTISNMQTVKNNNTNSKQNQPSSLQQLPQQQLQQQQQQQQLQQQQHQQLQVQQQQQPQLNQSPSQSNPSSVGGIKQTKIIAAGKSHNPNKTNSSNATNSSNGNSGSNGNSKKDDDARNEFTSWCIKTLSSMHSAVDVPTFIAFLQDIESPYEVKDYIRMYLGETKECNEFAKQFLERRSKYKNQQRAQNAHIDDMCSPAPAINPSNDFQEVKGKGKKMKKNKMTKLDARILGFSVTAAQDRINVGDRDYGDAS